MTALLADGFTQLVFHVLAQVRAPGPGDLYDRRYVAWAAEHFAIEQSALLEHDAALIARSWAANPRYDRLHRLCDLRACSRSSPPLTRP